MTNCLTCGVVFIFPIGNLGQVWCLIVSIPDLCTLSYFGPLMCKFWPIPGRFDLWMNW